MSLSIVHLFGVQVWQLCWFSWQMHKLLKKRIIVSVPCLIKSLLKGVTLMIDLILYFSLTFQIIISQSTNMSFFTYHFFQPALSRHLTCFIRKTSCIQQIGLLGLLAATYYHHFAIVQLIAWISILETFAWNSVNGEKASPCENCS